MKNSMKRKKNSSIFMQLFQIKGKHAEMIRNLADVLSCRNLDIFYLAIVLGLEYKRTANIDLNTEKVQPAKIDPEQMIRYNDDIQFFYKMVMLADKDYCPSAQTRMDKAFRDDIQTKEEDETHFIKVMLGGLEFLNERIKLTTTPDKKGLFYRLYDMIEEFKDKHQNITEDSFVSKQDI